jgi:hypothetical protein
MSTNFNPTAEEVISELNNSTEGKTQLELAALRVIISKQQAHIQEIDSAESAEEDGK